MRLPYPALYFFFFFFLIAWSLSNFSLTDVAVEEELRRIRGEKKADFEFQGLGDDSYVEGGGGRGGGCGGILGAH